MRPHRFSCCSTIYFVLAEQAATYKGRALLRAPAQNRMSGLPAYGSHLGCFDGIALLRLGMKDARLRQKVTGQPLDPLPRRLIPLAAAPLSSEAQPELDDASRKVLESTDVGRHRVIVEPPADRSAQPLPLSGNRLVHPPPHFLLHRPKLQPATDRAGISAIAGTCHVATCREIKVKPRKLKVSGLPSPRFSLPLPPLGGRIRSGGFSPDAASVRTPRACLHHFEEPMGVGLRA